uniref:Uncharacterized protein n=1 Tax=viral metagenome TaxID=1070528 RepID=A0A6C0C2D5_9ZZZZ
MAFPFPDDRIALSRLNWCRNGAETDYDGLSCVLRARMCQSHIDASNNSAWAMHSSQAFGELLAAANVAEWTACPQGNVSGICGLLLGDRYAAPLWRKFGHDREQKAYHSISTGMPVEMPAPQREPLPDCAYPNDAYS